MNKRWAITIAAVSAGVVGVVDRPASGDGPTTEPSSDRRAEQRLSFQASGVWEPRVNVNSDVAMAYGIDKTLPARIQSWKDHGYIPQLMTGVAWGNYQDYIHGQWDGKDHMDEAQTDHTLKKVAHGKDVYYMCPGPTYGEYLSVGVCKALDAGATAVYLEEPEFWVKSGWEDGFKREWKEFYHEDWQAPDSSPDAQFRASKLKYHLYQRALAQVFANVKKWGDVHNTKIPCYVPTHSLINYAQWGIVSPESSLLDVGCDGYIAQVWTGTSREPNTYEGKVAERTFETAFLEYGAMQNLVRASGRRVWYLNDPIEDNPRHPWSDYRMNWENTLTASLLQPEVDRYEIMPWPHRIFKGKYPASADKNADRVPIPPEYETELQSVITALGDMKQPADRVKWEVSGTQGVGVLVSDTMMFQRGDPTPSDSRLGSFYGLAMPLVKRGLPAEPVQIESAGHPNFLSRYHVLLLTYEGQKPPTPQFHRAISDWVKAGGVLVVVDDDKDPYNGVHDWWNTAPMNYATPRHHLFEALGVLPGVTGMSKVGDGAVIYEAASPAAISHDPNGANHVRQLVKTACDSARVPYTETGAMVLRRGPYVIAAGLTDSVPNATPTKLAGKFVPLFDAALPVVDGWEVKPGSRAVLVDLDKAGNDVAVAGRLLSVSGAPPTYRIDGLEGSAGMALLRTAAVAGVTVDGQPADKRDWQYDHGLLRVRFTNHAAGVNIGVVP